MLFPVRLVVLYYRMHGSGNVCGFRVVSLPQPVLICVELASNALGSDYYRKILSPRLKQQALYCMHGVHTLLIIIC